MRNPLLPTARTIATLALLALPTWVVAQQPIPTSYADLFPPNPSGPALAATAPVESVPLEATPTPVEVVAPPPAVVAGPVTPEEAPAVLEPVTPEAVPAEAIVAVEPSPGWYQPAYWFGPAPWDAGIEFGLNGSSGTSESLSFRGGGYAKRSAEDYKFAGSLYYNKTQSNGIETQSNALLDLRYDWLFDDSPWTLFVMNQTFYDEFQAFDLNVNVNTGFGYQWLKQDWTNFTTSVGTGAAREFGGPDSEWVPEAQFGVDYELKFSDGKRFYAKSDWFPEWEDFNKGRVLTDIGLQMPISELSNMSLKLSATDRYDADPQGVSPHNLNYSAMLIWKL